MFRSDSVKRTFRWRKNWWNPSGYFGKNLFSIFFTCSRRLSNTTVSFLVLCSFDALRSCQRLMRCVPHLSTARVQQEKILFVKKNEALDPPTPNLNQKIPKDGPKTNQVLWVSWPDKKSMDPTNHWKPWSNLDRWFHWFSPRKMSNNDSNGWLPPNNVDRQKLKSIPKNFWTLFDTVWTKSITNTTTSTLKTCVSHVRKARNLPTKGLVMNF